MSEAEVCRLIEQQRRRHLDEADAAVGEFARLDPQIGDVIDRETVTSLRQRREMLGLDRAEIAERRLLEFEHERRRQRPVGLEEIQALREGRRDCPSVAAATLQNTPTSLLRTISRRSTCTHFSITV